MRFTKKQRKEGHYSPEATKEKDPKKKTKPAPVTKTERTEDEKRYDIDAGLS